MASEAGPLVAGAAVVFGGIAASIIFEKWRVPDVVILLAAGLVAGPLLGLVDPKTFTPFAPAFATLALAVILFEGGLDLRLKHLRRGLGLTTGLLVASYFVVAVAVAVVAHYMLGMSWNVGFLAGFALAPLSSSIVIPLLARLRVKKATKTLLTVESALGDVLAVLAVTMLAGGLTGEAPSAEGVTRTLITSLILGALVALLAGAAWLYVLRYINERPYAYLSTFAASILLFGLVGWQGGNGVVAILVFALVLGNADSFARVLPGSAVFRLSDRIKWFHGEVSFLVRTFFFLYLGLSVTRDAFAPHILFAGVVAVLAMLTTRWLVVRAIVRRHRDEAEDADYLTFLAGRGLASAALATLPAVILAAGSAKLVELAFSVILISNIAMTVFLLVKEHGFGGGAAVDETLAGLAFDPAAWESFGPQEDNENAKKAPAAGE